MQEAGQGGSRLPLVTGRIHIAARVPAFLGATVHIRLEDVSYADAASSVLAQSVLPNVDHGPSLPGAAGGAETVIPFELYALPDALEIDPRHDYSVSVWVDRDGDGTPGPEDLYSEESHPVITRGFGRTVTVRLAPR